MTNCFSFIYIDFTLRTHKCGTHPDKVGAHAYLNLTHDKGFCNHKNVLSAHLNLANFLNLKSVYQTKQKLIQ